MVDRLSSMFEHFRVRASLLHAGPLCGVTSFGAAPGRGFLHVLRAGEMTVSHVGTDGAMQLMEVDTPSLLFYPRPLEHSFHNAPTDDSDFACATVEVDGGGGGSHPLFSALPPVVVIALDDVRSLRPALDLLFLEVDGGGCGQRMIVDRLFEVVLLQLFRWILGHTDELHLHEGLIAGLADPYLARTLVAIHDAPGKDWSLATMARTAGMSRSSFAARFTSRVGASPGDYLTTWRMTLAQGMLRDGKQVCFTASQLGYASPAAFTRAFTQRIGASPRHWLATAVD
ncbi:AraC family transcriptional regulator [Mycolicibacterium sp. A43C]